MNIFLDDFTIYSDMEIHLMKFKLFFKKCKEYKINQPRKMCLYDIFRTNFKVHSFKGKKNTKP
jgi:hypothetical protein